MALRDSGVTRTLVAIALALVACATPALDDPAAQLEAAARALRAGDVKGARSTYRALAEAGHGAAQEALATMLLEGLGGPADRPAAMRWLCARVHDPEGGPNVVRALWYLAEYHRTGGGLPGGRRYDDGERGAEDPVKAYFWFGVLAGQQRYFATTVPDGVTLGRVGMSEIARELFARERERADAALERWSPHRRPVGDAGCLDLPGN